MIPARRLSGENYGNGVSYRVAICRKRLRAGRGLPRRQFSPGSEVQLTPHPEGHSLISTDVANELPALLLLPRQTQLAVTAGSTELVAAVAPVMATGSAAQEKAEET